VTEQGAGAEERLAWVRNQAERAVHERYLRRLVGRAVVRVRYVEIQYEGLTEPAWLGGVFDSLDFGLEMDVDGGATWSVIWKQGGRNEGLLVYQGSLVGSEIMEGSSIAIWDATDRWRELGPHVIASVIPVWTRPFEEESDLCLGALVLASEDQKKAVLTLGDRGRDLSYKPSHDNVAVFFSLDDARSAGVVFPGDHNAVP
jgi:hypothetical protein